jgi:hypothetical protein
MTEEESATILLQVQPPTDRNAAMSQILLNHIQGLLNNLSKDIQTMSDGQNDQGQRLFEAIDDIAAHTLATQAVLVELMTKVQVDQEKIRQWIVTRTSEFSGEGGSQKALALADLLMTGKAPE